MISELLIVFGILNISYSVDLYDDYDSTTHRSNPTTELATVMNFEPVVPYKEKEKVAVTKNLSCEEFPNYTINCTNEAAMIYNSSKKTPPMPGKLRMWCKAIRHLTNCAIDWNSECKDVTESHFNEESIKGHMHVLNNVCDDEWFLPQYDLSSKCIVLAAPAWEVCYTAFKAVVDRQKNGPEEWTHYLTHFHLCCARTRFRRCTFEALFNGDKCDRDQAVVLQKFSVIVSQGDVFQDCDHFIAYATCPGGDPRPDKRMRERLLNKNGSNTNSVFNYCYCILQGTLLILVYLLK